MKTSQKVIAIKSLDSITQGIRSVPRPVHGWLRAIRDIQGLSRNTVARLLGVSTSAVQDYEKSEKADTITLATMRRYALRLDCDLVVAMVPRDGKIFTDLAAQHDPDLVHLRATEHSMALENQASDDLDGAVTETVATKTSSPAPETSNRPSSRQRKPRSAPAASTAQTHVTNEETSGLNERMGLWSAQ